MRIYSWNINGIRAVLKKGDLERFLQEHKPDILCLQETKATREQVDADFPDYEEFWCSADRKGYSGTAIFVRCGLKKRPTKAINGLPPAIIKKYSLKDAYGDTTTEGRVITLEFEDFYVVSVYTPNAKDDLSRIPMRTEWDPAFLSYMKQLEKKKPLIFCGDFNVAHTEDDLARPKENDGKKGFTQEERNGFDAFVNAGFVDSFREFVDGNGYYTWWSHWGAARDRNVGWRIDYIMVSPKLRLKLLDAQIHSDVMGSDHCPVSIEVKL
jgi:exodeoxyribonuclease III